MAGYKMIDVVCASILKLCQAKVDHPRETLNIPLETEADKNIFRLLPGEEKDILLKLRHTYILKNLTPPQTN
jgi:hypothetical protein